MESSQATDAVKTPGVTKSASGLSRFVLLWHFLQLFHLMPLPESEHKAEAEEIPSSEEVPLQSGEDVLTKHNLPKQLPTIIDIKRVSTFPLSAKIAAFYYRHYEDDYLHTVCSNSCLLL